MVNSKILNKKKEYLQLYKTSKLSIKIIKFLIESLEKDRDCDSSFMSKYKEFSKKNVNEEIIKGIEQLIEKKNSLCSNILLSINTLEDDIEKNILILKYINFYTWEQISDVTHYSTRQLHNIHKKALLNIKII